MLTEGWNFNGVMARQHSESVQRYGSSATGRLRSQKFHERQSFQSWPQSCIVHCSRSHFCPPLVFGFQSIFYIVLERTWGQFSHGVHVRADVQYSCYCGGWTLLREQGEWSCNCSPGWHQCCNSKHGPSTIRAYFVILAMFVDFFDLTSLAGR
jgi:hypothetical protein